MAPAHTSTPHTAFTNRPSLFPLDNHHLSFLQLTETSPQTHTQHVHNTHAAKNRTRLNLTICTTALLPFPPHFHPCHALTTHAPLSAG